MGRTVDLDDLVDAGDVARILGLANSGAVYVYLKRYPDMPRPVYDRGVGKAKLWLRPEVRRWAEARGR